MRFGRWTMSFPGNTSTMANYQQKCVQETLHELKAHKHPAFKKYLYRRQRFEYEMPGHRRRNQLKEAARKADRLAVQEIISDIFAQKQIKNPPASLKDLSIPKKNK